MEPWEKALYKFVVLWKKRAEVEGALVAGSYVWGCPTKYSDIDVHIVLSDKVDWRERGNKIVDGFLIEYFANPSSQIRSYMREDYGQSRKVDARMFSKGRVLFDKSGVLKKLRQKANEEMKRKLHKLRGMKLELAKYVLWDHLDNLRDLQGQKSPNFRLLYDLLLEKIISTYAKFLGAEIAAPAKLYAFFSDESFRKAYDMPGFPDKRFSRMVIACFRKTELRVIQQLTLYSLSKMGGLKIDGWKARTPLKIT